MRTFQEQKSRTGAKQAPIAGSGIVRFGKNGPAKSGPGGLAAGIIGPVAIEPGHAPFDALAEAGKTAILDDRIMHDVGLAVAQHNVGAAIAARNVVGLPGPERGLMDRAIGGDLQGRIPEGAFLLVELAGDGPKGGLAGL